MGMLVKDIFKMGIFKEAELAAGRTGLYNEIVWINMMEILDVLDSLQKGEMLITTGYDLDNREKYGDIIFKLKEIGLAGIGIQPGYYLEDIPAYIIETADQCGFPVIRIPPKITFSHITRTIYKELLNREDNKQASHGETSNVILDLLEGKQLEKASESYLLDILAKDEKSKSHLAVLGIAHKEDGIIVRSDIEASVKRIRDALARFQSKVHCEGIRGSSVFLFSTPPGNLPGVYAELESTTAGLAKHYPNLTFTCGLSSAFNSIAKINQSYYEALAIQQTLDKIKVVKGVCRYEEGDILQILDNPESREHLTAFMDATLRELISYDEANKTNFYATLKCYLQNNCNMNYSAKSLFIHRHTLRYRLAKIARLCKIDFLSFKSRLQYMLAMMLYDFYS